MRRTSSAPLQNQTSVRPRPRIFAPCQAGALSAEQPSEYPVVDGTGSPGVAGMPMASPMDQNIVPQHPGVPHRLNSIEKQELELARRRAEKAAEGKRANAAAARARRRATRPRVDERIGVDGDGEGEASQGEEDDLEAKLAATKDEKEAKRLRR